jgi:hypothetical protein
MNLLSAPFRCCSNGLLLQWGIWITNVNALIQILLKKLLESTEPLILQCVNKLVKNQLPIVPAVRPDENAIPQCQAAGARRDELSRF